jgi:hypothetical protein
MQLHCKTGIHIQAYFRKYWYFYAYISNQLNYINVLDLQVNLWHELTTMITTDFSLIMSGIFHQTLSFYCHSKPDLRVSFHTVFVLWIVYEPAIMKHQTHSEHKRGFGSIQSYWIRRTNIYFFVNKFALILFGAAHYQYECCPISIN